MFNTTGVGQNKAASAIHGSSETHLRAVSDVRSVLERARQQRNPAAAKAAQHHLCAAIEAAHDAGATRLQIRDLSGIARGKRLSEVPPTPRPTQGSPPPEHVAIPDDRAPGLPLAPARSGRGMPRRPRGRCPPSSARPERSSKRCMAFRRSRPFRTFAGGTSSSIPTRCTLIHAPPVGAAFQSPRTTSGSTTSPSCKRATSPWPSKKRATPRSETPGFLEALEPGPAYPRRDRRTQHVPVSGHVGTPQR